MNNQQRWQHGDWMLKAFAEAKKKQRRKQREPQPTDIFKYGISYNEKKDEVKVYRHKNGSKVIEVESYDEAQRLLNEEYGMGA